MKIQKRQEYLPEDVAVAMTVVVEKRTLILERGKNPNASTGTTISDLNGIAKSLAMISNLGGGSKAIGGGGVEEGIRNINDLARARHISQGIVTEREENDGQND